MNSRSYPNAVIYLAYDNSKAEQYGVLKKRGVHLACVADLVGDGAALDDARDL